MAHLVDRPGFKQSAGTLIPNHPCAESREGLKFVRDNMEKLKTLVQTLALIGTDSDSERLTTTGLLQDFMEVLKLLDRAQAPTSFQSILTDLLNATRSLKNAQSLSANLTVSYATRKIVQELRHTIPESLQILMQVKVEDFRGLPPVRYLSVTVKEALDLVEDCKPSDRPEVVPNFSWPVFGGPI